MEQVINFDQLRRLRQMRRDVKQQCQTDYAKLDDNFLKAANDFVKRIPAKDDDLIQTIIKTNLNADDLRDEFISLLDWSTRLFEAWCKGGTKKVTEIKYQDTPENIEMKKVTKKEGKGQLSLSFRGGARPGAGRKRIGTTKTIKLTLPDDIWEIIKQDRSPSEAIRNILMHYYDPRNER